MVDVSVDTREEGPDLNIRLSVASKVMSPGAEVGAWCVFCDSKDNCTKCDAFDCIGCDAEEFHSQEDIVSNPAPMTKDQSPRTRDPQEKLLHRGPSLLNLGRHGPARHRDPNLTTG